MNIGGLGRISRIVVAVAAAALASVMPFTAASGASPSAGTNIGNAGILSSTGSGVITPMSDDWWVIYPSQTGGSVSVQVENTAPSGNSCSNDNQIKAYLEGPDGTSQIIQGLFVGPGSAVPFTFSMPGADRYFIEVQPVDSACQSLDAPYTLTLAGGGGPPPLPVPSHVPASPAQGNAWPPLQGHSYDTGTLASAGSQAWYVLYNQPGTASASIRVQDTTVYQDASVACPGLTVSLLDAAGVVSSAGLYGSSATTFTLPGTTSGGTLERYYLEITFTGCDLRSTYSIEPEPGAGWGNNARPLPYGPSRKAAGGPLAGAVSYSAPLAKASAPDWAYFAAAGAVAVHVENTTNTAAGCQNVDVTVLNSHGKVASRVLGAAAVAQLRVRRAGAYDVRLSPARGCTPESPLSVLLELSGRVRGPVLRVTDPALKSGVLHEAYTAKIRVTGGKRPYTFTALTALPPGLSLNRHTGAIAGTPTKAGTFAFMVSVTDSAKPAHKSVTARMQVTISRRS